MSETQPVEYEHLFVEYEYERAEVISPSPPQPPLPEAGRGVEEMIDTCSELRLVRLPVGQVSRLSMREDRLEACPTPYASVSKLCASSATGGVVQRVDLGSVRAKRRGAAR